MSKEITDLAQTIIFFLTLVAAFVTIWRQSREMSRSQELAAATTLFTYYNAKISSLRESIVRDAHDADAALIDSLEQRRATLEELLDKHAKVRERLERLYGELAG